jgi:hypothetical protein
MNYIRLAFLYASALALGAAVHAQPLGLFQSNGDVGTVLHPGSAVYDPAAKTYTVTGSGENMWFNKDAFQFVWVKVSGDVQIAANAVFPKPGGDGHRKAALMIRQSLDFDSVYIDAALHGDGLTSMQTRQQQGGTTFEIRAPISAPARYQLTKDGDQFYLSVAAEGEALHPAGGAVRVALKDPYYVGIAVCAHDKDDIQTAVFSNVVLKRGAVARKRVLRSTIEGVPVPAGDRAAIYSAPGSIVSAGWNAEGALVYTLGGKAYQIPAGAKTPQAAKAAAEPAAPAVAFTKELGHNADPTVTATDGMIYFASDRGGTWQIWKMNPDGSGAAQVTNDEFSSYSPRLSPDKSRLVFLTTAKSAAPIAAESELTLRTLALSDGKLGTLARFVGGPGALGTQCFAADGKRVAYVSNQRLAEEKKGK